MRIEASLIARWGPRSYLRSSMFRLLASLLVAMALFLSPLAMSGAGMATSHAAAAADAKAVGHCPGDEAPAEQKAPPGASCASACAAFPADGPVPSREAPVAHGVPLAGKSQRLSGIHPEGETPPPRMTPEV